MSNIEHAIKILGFPEKEIGTILIDFYETMKALEKDTHRGGKQAVCIVMAINDIKKLIPHEDQTKS